MANNEDAVININTLQDLFKKELHAANLGLKKEITCLNNKMNDQYEDRKKLTKSIKKIDDKIDDNYQRLNKAIEDKVKVLEDTLKEAINNSIEEEIEKINKKMQKLRKYTLDREKDRDNSYRYLLRSHFSSTESRSTLVDDGDAFLSSPDEYVPEHPFSR